MNVDEEHTDVTNTDVVSTFFCTCLFLHIKFIYTWDLSISSCIAEDKELIIASRSPNGACILTLSLLPWDTFRA